jgi:hypothetical protein
MGGLILEKQLIAYCGIDCSACPAYQITRAGGDLVARRKLAQEWSGVQCQFDAEEIACNGCMHSSWKMTERCNIRKCAIEKEKKTCGHCADYPCDKPIRITVSSNSHPSGVSYITAANMSSVFISRIGRPKVEQIIQ